MQRFIQFGIKTFTYLVHQNVFLDCLKVKMMKINHVEPKQEMRQHFRIYTRKLVGFIGSMTRVYIVKFGDSATISIKAQKSHAHLCLHTGFK